MLLDPMISFARLFISLGAGCGFARFCFWFGAVATGFLLWNRTEAMWACVSDPSDAPYSPGTCWLSFGSGLLLCLLPMGIGAAMRCGILRSIRCSEAARDNGKNPSIEF